MTLPRGLRRGRVLLRALAALLGIAATTPAEAQEVVDPLDADPRVRNYQSPQHFHFEVKVGPYSPNIDATAGLTGTPFSDLFNSQLDASKRGQRPGAQPLTTLELDWQFWHGFGSLGLAGSIGYMGRQTHSFAYQVDPATGLGTTNTCQVPNCIRSSDTTQLNVFPITLELVYRFDVLALRYSVPIVPYVKAGLGYYFWFIQRGDAQLAYDVKNPDSKAIGGVPGWVVHPGVAILLDVLDRAAARTMDTELGINHTYIFAELSHADITGLGIFKDKINLSDTTWNAGVAFEF